MLLAERIEEVSKEKIIPSVLPELKEVDFNLNLIYPRLPDHIDIEAMNRDVFRAMLSGIGAESIQTVCGRVESIFKFLGNGKPREIILVTHDFLMRVIEIYVRSGGPPSQITYEDLLRTNRNLYLRGFATDSLFSKVQAL